MAYPARSRVIPIQAAATGAAQEPAVHDEAACAGAEVFALRVMGRSMAPEFADGDIVVIEPGGALREGCFVLAELPQQGWVLRQLTRVPGDEAAAPQRDQAGWWLQVLDASCPPWPLVSLDEVAGVVIQRARPGRRKETRWYTA